MEGKVKERDEKVDELQKVIDDKAKENKKLLEQMKKAEQSKGDKDELEKKA